MASTDTRPLRPLTFGAGVMPVLCSSVVAITDMTSGERFAGSYSFGWIAPVMTSTFVFIFVAWMASKTGRTTRIIIALFHLVLAFGYLTITAALSSGTRDAICFGAIAALGYGTLTLFQPKKVKTNPRFSAFKN